MKTASNHSIELVRTQPEQDLNELATIAETLSVIEQWVRCLPNKALYAELSKQLRMAEIEARRLIEDEDADRLF